MREGAALLQGIATCGNCGRKLKVYYQGKNSTPGYHCPGNTITNGRGLYCLRVGGVRIDAAVAEAFLKTVEPGGLEAAMIAESELEAEHDAAKEQWRLEVERLRYEAGHAERRYRAVDPENRLVARGLERDWEQRLQKLADAETELTRREQSTPQALSQKNRVRIHELSKDLTQVWSAPTTVDRDRKELLQTLLEEVCISVDREAAVARLILRWRGGMISDLEIDLWNPSVPTIKTDEDTVQLIKRLAVHYPDGMIAGILNRQERKTATGQTFTANRVSSLRNHRKIPRYKKSDHPDDGDLATVEKTAALLNVAPSTVHRWLNDGFVAGEQLTPGAPWRIRITDDLLSYIVEETPDGYVPMQVATKKLGVSRQTVLQRVKRGELDAVHVRCGKQTLLKIKMLDNQPKLFNELS